MSSRDRHMVATPSHDAISSFKSIQSPSVAKVRTQTLHSGRGYERNAKLKIDMDQKKGKMLKTEKFSPEFRFNAEMALRVAFGVLIASAVQTRSSEYQPGEHDTKRWVLFPDWYYFGGLSYCAVAVIFSAKANAGATIREMCQAFIGVGMALVYNMILFSVYTLRMSDPNSEDPEKGFYQITRTFSSAPYWVNLHNFYVILPFIMFFTVGVLLLPFETNTKKFAVGNNLFFALTILNPTSPLDSSKLKTTGDPLFAAHNILNNLQLYFFVGFLGTCISVFIMFVPYPVFAVNRLREETERGVEEVMEILNLIVDSYCFKNKNVNDMAFLKVQLHQKFTAAEERNERMTALVEDVWWEQLFGITSMLKFNRSMFKNQIALLGSLVSDLRSLNHAMQLEQYEDLHFEYMKVLQREIYVIQVRSGELLNEISTEVRNSNKTLQLRALQHLETQMEKTLRLYRSIQARTMLKEKVTIQDVAGNVPLNLFLFSLNSFCATMIDYQGIHNKKKYADSTVRARSFVAQTIKDFYNGIKYDRLKFIGAFKASAAICFGTILAVYVYAYSSTTPSAVAFVMGNHLGGSFSITVNRVGGVVAGSVVPSVFQFFISQVCYPQYINVFLTNFALFVWVACSMYFRFAGGYGNYAGLVSAFIAAGIFLKQSDVCYENGKDTFGSIAISSYASLAQTSVGVILFVLVELALCPESAANLLRHNIQETLGKLQESFDVLFGHHLSSANVISEDDMEHLRMMLETEIPKLIVEQEKLLLEADAEPTLWRPAFSAQKYEMVINNSRRLLSNNNSLFKLVRWFQFRVKHHNVSMMDTADIRVDDDDNVYNDGDTKSYNKWAEATHEFRASVKDTFTTLHTLFGDTFENAEPDQTVLYMQIKEAFRLADKDCSGEIDASEVRVMLQSIFAQAGSMKEGDIVQYVAEFMAVVDKDGSGKVSFEEFMEALENGLKLEVEVYHQRKPKSKQTTSSKDKDLESFHESFHHTPSRGGALLKIKEEQSASQGDLNDSPAATLDHTTMNVTAELTPKHGEIRPLSPMRREHEVINVESFSLMDIAASMKAAYVGWLMQDRRYERVSMEELLLLNCLVSGAEGVALNLSALEEIVVSSLRPLADQRHGTGTEPARSVQQEAVRAASPKELTVRRHVVRQQLHKTCVQQDAASDTAEDALHPQRRGRRARVRRADRNADDHPDRRRDRERKVHRQHVAQALHRANSAAADRDALEKLMEAHRSEQRLELGARSDAEVDADDDRMEHDADFKENGGQHFFVLGLDARIGAELILAVRVFFVARRDHRRVDRAQRSAMGMGMAMVMGMTVRVTMEVLGLAGEENGAFTFDQVHDHNSCKHHSQTETPVVFHDFPKARIAEHLDAFVHHVDETRGDDNTKAESHEPLHNDRVGRQRGDVLGHHWQQRTGR
ncbi:Transmembrane protein, partial [Globisporangium splendens]